MTASKKRAYVFKYILNQLLRLVKSPEQTKTRKQDRVYSRQTGNMRSILWYSQRCEEPSHRKAGHDWWHQRWLHVARIIGIWHCLHVLRLLFTAFTFWVSFEENAYLCTWNPYLQAVTTVKSSGATGHRISLCNRK